MSKFFFVLVLVALLGCETHRSCSLPPLPRSHAIADTRTYLTNFCQLAQLKWPNNRRLTIVCHGHSVPSGYFKTPDVRTFDAYPHLLHVELKKQFPYAVMNVIVTGIGGENSESGAARFERDVLSLCPDVVTIDYALNDRGIGLERARVAWKKMIEQAQQLGIKVILLTPTPDMNAHLSDPHDSLNQQAQQIRDLAAEYHVGLVDSAAAFAQSVADGGNLRDLMAQSNHPNRQGHELVAKRLMEWFPAQ